MQQRSVHVCTVVHYNGLHAIITVNQLEWATLMADAK